MPSAMCLLIPGFLVIVPMFQVANLMQSGTLEVFSVPPPTGFPAWYQVYDLHNDGNSVLQFGRVPHRSVCCSQIGLPMRYIDMRLHEP